MIKAGLSSGREAKLLASVAAYFGKGMRWVQAAGGNISLKLPDGILIKSSGIRLRELKVRSGYLKIALQRQELIEQFCAEETSRKSIARMLHSAGSGSRGARPSIEILLHLLTAQRLTVHLHPIAIDAVLCSTLSDQACKRIFTRGKIRPVIVPYTRPGIPLAYQAFRRLKQSAQGQTKSQTVLLLRNHGIVVAAEEKKELLRVSKRVYKIAEEFLCGFRRRKEVPLQRSPAKGILFPDMAVYCGVKSRTPRARKFAAEVLTAHRRVLSLIRRRRLKPRYLSENEVADILGMKGERYRQHLLGDKK